MTGLELIGVFTLCYLAVGAVTGELFVWALGRNHPAAHDLGFRIHTWLNWPVVLTHYVRGRLKRRFDDEE